MHVADHYKMACSVGFIHAMVLISTIHGLPNYDYNGLSCPSNCTCWKEDSEIGAECHGSSLSHILNQLSVKTTSFKYVAHEQEIDLLSANFSTISHLKSLEITTYSSNYNCRIKDMYSNEIHTFEPLKRLRKLKMNIIWSTKMPYSSLFAPLQNLHELDLSSTSEIDYLKLADSFVPFKTNCTLENIKLDTIQTIRNAGNKTIMDLSVLLKFLKACPLRKLNLKYNALQKLLPGLIQFAPNLEYIDLSNNMFGEGLLISTMTMDIILHPNIRYVDISQQGYRPYQDNTLNIVTGR